MSDRVSQNIASKGVRESGMSNYSNAKELRMNTGANILGSDVPTTPNTGASQRCRPNIKMNNLLSPTAAESQYNRGNSLTV
jgi:hypothetical protein